MNKGNSLSALRRPSADFSTQIFQQTTVHIGDEQSLHKGAVYRGVNRCPWLQIAETTQQDAHVIAWLKAQEPTGSRERGL